MDIKTETNMLRKIERLESKIEILEINMVHLSDCIDTLMKNMGLFTKYAKEQIKYSEAIDNRINELFKDKNINT